MSDEHDEHDWVREALADAGRSPEPAPPWVVDRIEQTLEELRAPEAAPVVAMTPRRHRRWAGALLAAAALTAGGYSIAATGVLGQPGAGESDSAAAGDASQADQEAGGATARGDRDAVTVLSTDSLRTDARLLVLEVRSGVVASEPLAGLPAPQKLGDDLASSQADAEGSPAAPEAATKSQRSQSSTEDTADDTGATRDRLDGAPRALRCAPPPRSQRGARVPVSLDADPATAVVRRLDADRSLVTVWSCDGSQRLAQVTVRP